MKDPTVFIIGLLREAMLLTLHPAFAAAAVDHDSFNDDPVMRFKHVAWYTYAATYGSPADAEHVSNIVRRRHKMIVGSEPLTGLPYRADSEYELALTQAMLSASFLATYELLHGELSSAQRDQFFREQLVPAALLGTNPDHLPETYGQAIDFIAHARNRFATGLQAREILSPFARGEYPRGTAIGDLPIGVRQIAMFILRAFADMAMVTMSWEERELISISRRPKLGHRLAVHASLRLLSKWFCGEQGQKVFESFLGEHVAPLFVRAKQADEAPGGRTRAAQFVVPDAAPCLVVVPYLVHNWPGTTGDYVLGQDASDLAPPADTANILPIDERTLS
ncbi:MAG: oxygenase MpaB family protein [Mycobacterium sp.]|nr:oxygenase MpaB family protein [Mycobacterium sp.]